LYPGDRGQARRLAAAVPGAPSEPEGLPQEIRRLGGAAQSGVEHPEVAESHGLALTIAEELPDLQSPAVGVESLLRLEPEVVDEAQVVPGVAGGRQIATGMGEGESGPGSVLGAIELPQQAVDPAAELVEHPDLPRHVAELARHLERPF